MKELRQKVYILLRKSEKYFKTDMVYLVRGSIWLNTNMVITTMLAFLLSVAFANLMPKEQYGLYQFALSIGSILTAFTLTGMNVAVSRSVSMGFEGSFIPSIKIQLKYGFLSFLLSVCIAAYYFYQSNIQIALAVLILGIFIPIQNSFNTYPAFIGGKKDFRRSFWFAQALAIPYTIVMIASLSVTHNPIIIILINLSFNSLANIILHFVTIHIYNPNKKVDPTTISYGKHLSWVGILSTVAGQLDNLLVYHYIGAAQLAVYAFATTIPERVNTSAKVIGNMAFPKFSNKSVVEIRKVIIFKSLQTAIFSLFISSIYIFTAHYIFVLFFPNYLGSVLYSQVYAAMLAISTLTTLPLTALTALQARKEILIFNILNPIINISVLLVAAYLYGIWGLIIAKGVTGILIFITSLMLLFFIKEGDNSTDNQLIFK